MAHTARGKRATDFRALGKARERASVQRRERAPPSGNPARFPARSPHQPTFRMRKFHSPKGSTLPHVLQPCRGSAWSPTKQEGLRASLSTAALHHPWLCQAAPAQRGQGLAPGHPAGNLLPPRPGLSVHGLTGHIILYLF